MKLASERLTAEGDDVLAVSDLYYRRGWTDGLPIVPPTVGRVERMLAPYSTAPDKSFGAIPPSHGEATLEKIAVNAVMAGALPEHLPAIVSAIDATLDPALNLNGVQCTTGSTTPLILFNGPIRKQLEINCGAGAFGSGSRANAVIGRAVRLALMNIGGALPREIDKASLGQPGKYSFCFGENEEESPWEPYHVEQGFKREDSAVTAFGVCGSIEVADATSQTAEDVLKTFAHSITPSASVLASNGGEGGQPMVVCVPEHAAIIGASLSKAEAKARLWEEAVVPLSAYPPISARRIAEWLRSKGLPETGPARAARRPEDIILVVVGGPGGKSAFVQTWGGNVHAVTRPIRPL